MVKGALNQLIERTYFRGLVFNQSWEDPVLDREALRISADRDTVLSITSGGCNCLNLLCLRPRRLICVDANPAQTYLLELKLAGVRHLDHAEFRSLFTSRGGTDAVAIYRRALRPALPAEARGYWDNNTRVLERGILTQGKLGFFLTWLQRYLRWRVGEARVRRLFEAGTIDDQRDFYYREIHPRLWNGTTLRILGSRPVLACAGMHPAQYDLIRGSTGIERYIRDRVDYVLTRAPARDNYFVAQALLGTYTDAESVPPYLLERNFDTLRHMADRVVNITAPLAEYLDSSPESSIDRFNLLDIFDWMDRDAHMATVRSVLRAGSQGGRFIYRSAIPSHPVPLELRKVVISEDDLAQRLFERDRSCTYSSFYVYRIDKESAAA
jgi:S-adenosylmethionine-diacylglycerol 3-amino-3-carboxypropyl transferase